MEEISREHVLELHASYLYLKLITRGEDFLKRFNSKQKQKDMFEQLQKVIICGFISVGFTFTPK